MKKLNLLLVAFLIFAIQFTNAQKKKVAVVTFYADKVIGFEGLGGGYDFIAKGLLNLRNDPNFNLSPILEKYHSSFINEYAKQFPFELLPESQVLNNPKYISFVPKHEIKDYDGENYLVYNGYKIIFDGPLQKFNEEGIAKAMSDQADGVMFVEIDFQFVKGFGIGGTSTVKISAVTRISLYNKNGEKVLVINEGEQSKKTMVMVGGVPVIKAEKVLPMCESALSELMGDLDKRIAKVIKKSNEKL